MSAELWITGLGSVCAHGVGVDALHAALRTGRSGLTTFADPRLPLAERLPLGRVTARLPHYARTSALALCAAREALAGAHLPDAAVLVGTTTGGMCASEVAYLRDPTCIDRAYAAQPAHATAELLAHRLGLGGPQATHAEACAAAACALAEAAEWLRQGVCGAALVVGSDALTRLTMAGFNSLHVMDPAGCRPFTAERAGMSLGEGAAALLIERADHAQARGARPLARLLGWGVAADAHHQTAPEPDGIFLEQALRAALADARLPASALDWVHAHGTGTRDNDRTESLALARVCGALPVSSSKRVTGHTLGAAAAFGAVAACLALHHGERFPSAGAAAGNPLTEVDVVRSLRTAPLSTVGVTCLAFGGVDAALVFGGAP